jgi:hypothetical protein
MEQAKLFFILSTIVGLILAMIILPRIVSYVDRMEPHFAISGFQDMPAPTSEQAPRIEPTGLVKDPSSMVRKATCGTQVCPEGSFCDDLSQTCTPLYPSSDVPDEGYYA